MTEMTEQKQRDAYALSPAERTEKIRVVAGILRAAGLGSTNTLNGLQSVTLNPLELHISEDISKQVAKEKLTAQIADALHDLTPVGRQVIFNETLAHMRQEERRR